MHSKVICYIQYSKSNLPHHVLPHNAVKLLQSIEICIYSIINSHHIQVKTIIEAGKTKPDCGVRDINALERFMNYKQ
jgi:hypothetical protein